jgi:WD40 repeat protein
MSYALKTGLRVPLRVTLILAACAIYLPAASPTAALRFSPDSRLLAAAGGNSVRLLIAAGRAQDSLLTSKVPQVFDVAWSPNQKLLAIAGGEAAITGAVEIWDAVSKRWLRTLSRFFDLVYGVAFSPDGSELAAASADQRLQIFDVATGKTRIILRGHSGPVLCVAWSPDGKWIASGSSDRSIRLWEAATGKFERALTNHAGPVEALAFSSDSQSLFSASSDGTVRLWIPAQGRMKRIYRGYGLGALALAYAPAKNLLLTGSEDGAARLTKADTGEIVRTFPPEKHDGAGDVWLHAVAVSPDGILLAWANAAGELQIRRMPE